MKHWCFLVMLLCAVVLLGCAPSATVASQSPLQATPLQGGQTWSVEGTFQSQVVKMSVSLDGLGSYVFPQPNGEEPYSNLDNVRYRELFKDEAGRFTPHPYVGFDPSQRVIRFMWAWPTVRAPGSGFRMTERFECRITQYVSTDKRLAGTLRLHVPKILPSGEVARDTWTASGRWVDGGAWQDVGSCTATVSG